MFSFFSTATQKVKSEKLDFYFKTFPYKYIIKAAKNPEFIYGKEVSLSKIQVNSFIITSNTNHRPLLHSSQTSNFSLIPDFLSSDKSDIEILIDPDYYAADDQYKKALVILILDLSPIKFMGVDFNRFKDMESEMSKIFEEPLLDKMPNIQRVTFCYSKPQVHISQIRKDIEETRTPQLKGEEANSHWIKLEQ